MWKGSLDDEYAQPHQEDQNTSKCHEDEEGAVSASVSDHSASVLQDNFEQQQAMIGQLREALKSKEQEKEIEDYATRLAKMKPRLIRGRGRGKMKSKDYGLNSPSHRNKAEEILETSDSARKDPIEQPVTSEMEFLQQTEAPKVNPLNPILSTETEHIKSLEADRELTNPTAHSESSVVLKKEFMEESVVKKDCEPLMKTELSHLSSKESDVHSLTSSKLDRSTVSSIENKSRANLLLLRKQREEHRIKFERQQRENAEKKATMDEMKDRIEKLRTEVEKRDELIESFQVGSPADPSTQQLYQQILHKDNIIIDLSDKISQMEAFVQDQKEQLHEKSQIISARTEAVSLVTKDKDEKIQSIIQELDATQNDLKGTKENFLAKSAEWKSQEASLLSIIEEKNKKISVMEENFQRIEGIRFELSTRNAELQEKIVTLQTDGEELKKEIKKSKETSKKREDEVIDMQKKLVRAEAFGQKKLKAYEKQLKNIEKDSNVEGTILQLNNQIAELEDEKGNLQLKLVDFDDIKAANVKLSVQNTTFEQRVNALNTEFQAQLSIINELEKEKIKLIDALNEKDLLLLSFEETVSKNKFEIEELQQMKVTSDLRICALEEERDIAVNRQRELESRSLIPDDQPSALAYEKLKEDILHLRSQLEEEKQKKEQNLQELNERVEVADQVLRERDQKNEDYACLLNLLTEKESVITTQSIDIEKHDMELQSFINEIAEKTKLLQQQNDVIATMKDEYSEMTNRLEEAEAIVDVWEEKVGILQNDLISQKDKIEHLENHEKKIAQVVQDKNMLVQNLEGEICSLKDAVNKKEAVITAHINKLEMLDNLLLEREKMIEQLKLDYENSSANAVDLEAKNNKLEQDIANVQQSLITMKANFQAEVETMSCLLNDKENKIASYVNDLNIKQEEIRNNQKMIGSFEEDLCEKNRCYDSLLEEKSNLESAFNTLKLKFSKLNEELSYAKQDLEDVRSTLKVKEENFDETKGELLASLEKIGLKEELVSSWESSCNALRQENLDLRELIDQKEQFIKSLQNEISSEISSHKEESSNLASALVEKEMEIQQLQNSILSSSENAALQADLVEKWQTELSEKCKQISDAEEKLLAKDQEISALSENIQSINQSLLSSQTESAKMNEYFQEEFLKFQSHIQQLQESNTVNKNLLEVADQRNIELETEMESMKRQSEEKDVLIKSLSESKEGDIQVLHVQIAESQQANNNLKELKQTLENELDNVKLEFNLIQQQLSEMTIELDKLRKENDSLRNSLFQLEMGNTDFQNQLKLVTDENCKLLNDLSSARKDSDELVILKEKYSNTLKEIELLEASQESNNGNLPGSDLTIVKDHFHKSPSDDSLADVVTELQKDCQELENERNHLKTQLEEAQRAIVQLETSLATQSSSDTKSNDWDEWGIVDLGQPTVSDISMQTSLLEKDKTVTVIQEQLKDALEQVNTVTDEKKLIEHQMKILEAELSHKDQKITSLQELINKSKAESTALMEQIQDSVMQKSALDEANAKISALEFELSKSERMLSDLSVGIQSSNINILETDKASSADHVTTETALQSSQELQKEHASLVEDEESKELIKQLRYKISWYEEQWTIWTEHYNQLQHNYQTAEQQISHLTQQLQTLERTSLEKDTMHKEEIEASKLEQTSLQNMNEEIKRLRPFETETFQLKSHLQTLEHQYTTLEKNIASYQAECTRLQGVKDLYEKLQTSTMEAEAKREGSESRIQELELMVQSAESEISRLRTELQALTTAGKGLETERSGMVEEISNLKEEIRKQSSERERLINENSSLQTQVGTLHSQLIQHQENLARFNAENGQLRSEIEVLDGENERARGNYEVLESEYNRLRTEIDTLTQNNQWLEAHKESYETEIQRLNNQIVALVSEGEHLKGDTQRLTEVSTSAESEISRLKGELKSVTLLEAQYRELQTKNSELRERCKQLEEEALKKVSETQALIVEEADWGAEGLTVTEHFQTSASTSALESEVSSLKEQVITLEKEKNEATDELQASKLKNGRMIQKLKAATTKYDNLKKEFDKIKLKAGGFSDLDDVLEQEWKTLLSKAELEKDEFKLKIDELEKEKIELTNKLDVLEDAQDKYFNLKESQDSSLISLTNKNSELQNKVTALEWKLSEYEDKDFESTVPASSSEIISAVAVPSTSNSITSNEDIDRLNRIITELNEKISLLSSENLQLKQLNNDLETKLTSISNDNENFQDLLEKMRTSKMKAETDMHNYKSSYIELYTQHESLKDNDYQIQEQLTKLTHDHDTLQTAYDSLYGEYNNLSTYRDQDKFELGICEGERDKLQEQIDNLNKRLEILMEEEDEEIVRSLQEECASHQEANNELKDEITHLNEIIRQSVDETTQLKSSLANQEELQDLLRGKLYEKNTESDDLNSSLNEFEKEIKYLKAELAAFKNHSSQLETDLEESRTEVKKVKLHLNQELDFNRKLSDQVKLLESSTDSRVLPSVNNEDIASQFNSALLRDLRCQQLSIEINKLLEERDALQLKLSAALRQTQELGRELTLSQKMPLPSTNPPALKQKLDELHELNTSLRERTLSSGPSTLPPSPPTFMSHTAPPTPTSTRQLDYTATRSPQGSQSGLMGWILGKSPQKEVLHI